MHGSKTLSWYSQLPRGATESSQMALSDIFYSHVQDSPKPPKETADAPQDDPFTASAPDAESSLRMPPVHSLSRERSFEIQRVTNLKDIDPNWEDDEIDEVLVLSRKKHAKKLSVIRESVDSGKPSKKISISFFRLIRLLEGGSVSKVFLGKRQGDCTYYAIEVVHQAFLVEQQFYQRVITEQKMLKYITCSNLPFLSRLYWSFRDDEYLYIVTGYHPNTLQSLLAHDEPYFTERVLFYAAELADAISNLHSLGIIHRNIGPENVLLADDGHIVLTGLQHAAFVGTRNGETGAQMEPESVIGTAIEYSLNEEPLYQAPEIMLGWKHDAKVDVWSFGMLLYVLLTGQHPFLDDLDEPSNSGASGAYSKLLQSPLQLEVGSMDEQAADLIAQCLERNPALRLTMETVKAHAYFSSMDWAGVRSKKISGLIKRQSFHFHRLESDLDPELSLDPETIFASEHKTTVGEGTEPPVLDDFSFEWSGAEAEAKWQLKGLDISCPRVDESIEDPTTFTIKTNGTAPSASRSVTSFGELKRFQPVNVPQDSTPGSVQLSAGSDPFRITRRQSGPLLSLHESPARGQLRKYASLDFELDTIVSLSHDHSNSETQSLHKTPTGSKTTPLSHLPRWSPLKNFRFPRSTVSSSYPAHENILALRDTPVPATKKLRKKSRTPILPTPEQQQPILVLPQGIEQIGSGIGYMYTRSSTQPLLATTAQAATSSSDAPTPRRSLSFMRSNSRYSSLTVLPRRLLRTKKRSPVNLTDENTLHSRQANDLDEAEAAMKETYGSSWDLNSTGAAVRSDTGLGFGLNPASSSFPGLVTPVRSVGVGETFPRASEGTYGALGDSFFAGSTLRLVTPASRQESI